MPYISKEIREVLDKKIEEIHHLLHSVLYGNEVYGILNYITTRLLLGTCPQRYHDYNALIGVLECSKLELYRRAIADYEDKKREENGDVY